jgi:8-oxo-dGTP pyrophosphatase MutT (NUDIX family)
MVSLCSRVSALQSSPRDPKGAYFLVSSLVDLARASIAGKVDSTDSSVEEAAARELSEETGLPRSITLRKHGQIAYTFASNTEFDLHIHVFSCQLDGSEELLPSDEFESPLRWFGNREASIPYDRMVRVYRFHFKFGHFHPV